MGVGRRGERSPAALLAAVLFSSGARLVVVGGTARFLHGDEHWPYDLDVVLDGCSRSLGAAASMLGRLGVALPSNLLYRQSWSVVTSLGPLDVVAVVSPGSLPAAVSLDVAGVAVPVEVRA
ncbi:MAG TPA: hypothetical protein VGV93_04580 [Acidimicrobiales bacterium]|nr:hypothetical protein [Acidimicrobiales bacterium]